MSTKFKTSSPVRRRYWAAMVLGTAIAALGQSGQAAADISPRAVEDISRYCTVCWRNARLPTDRWNDCTQEVLCRLLQTLRPTAWTQVLAREGEERREFLRAIDAVKKRTQRERRRSPLAPDALADVRTPAHEARREQRDAVAHAARTLLSERQQRILEMTCQGWSIPDIASELGASAQRVSDEKYKAIHKLRRHFAE